MLRAILRFSFFETAVADQEKLAVQPVFKKVLTLRSKQAGYTPYILKIT